MYIIEIDKVYDENVLNTLYDKMEKSGIMNRAYIIRTLDKFDDSVKRYKHHFSKVKLSDFKEFNDTLLDVLMEISHNKINMIVDVDGVGQEFITEFNKVCEKLEIDFRVVGKEYISTFSLINTRKIEVETIKELYNHKSYTDKETPKYGIKDFLLRFRVDNNGDIYDNVGRKTGNIKKKSVYDTILKLNKDNINYLNNLEKEIENAEIIHGLKIKLAEPWYFLGDVENIIEDILEYKYRVFEMTKNIWINEYYNMDDEIKKVLREVRYLPLDVIIKAENKNNDLYITEWFLEVMKNKNKKE